MSTPTTGVASTSKPNVVSQPQGPSILISQQPLNLPCGDLLARREDYIKTCVPLYNASKSGDWEAANIILTNRKELVRFSITEFHETALHIASSTQHTEFVEALVELMEKEDLELQNLNGATALFLAVRAGNIKITEILVNKNRDLLTIPNIFGTMPLYTSSYYGNHDTTNYLYDNSQKMSGDFWINKNRGWVLLNCIEADLFGERDAYRFAGATFCLLCRCNFLLNGVLDKVLYLTRRREKYLVVAAIRFVRTLISHNDEHLASYIAKNNVFRPIIDAFVYNGSRYNLLNSAVLELFEHIRKENLKILLKYLIETFWDKLVKFDSLPSIQSLKLRYDQAQERVTNQNEEDSRRRVEERVLEKEEEDYFNENSDEEDSASASIPRSTRIHAQPGLANGSDASCPSLRPGGLVDYEDDEDDEDYKPPPKKQSEKSEDDEGSLEFRLKRKLLAAKEVPGVFKNRRLLGKNPKSKETLFATLCSTLSHAALPANKSTNVTIETNHENNHKSETSYEENGSVSQSKNSNEEK